VRTCLPNASSDENAYIVGQTSAKWVWELDETPTPTRFAAKKSDVDGHCGVKHKDESGRTVILLDFQRNLDTPRNRAVDFELREMPSS